MLSQPNKLPLRAGSHDFDHLKPAAGVEAAPATNADIPLLVATAHRTVPGVTLGAAELESYCRINPDTVLAFRRNGQLLGGIAFLFLNHDGVDALMLDDIDLARPQRRFLADADQEVAGIYWWALGAKGRGLAGLGQVARLFSKPKYRFVDFYAQPSSADGMRTAISLGFERIPSWQPDLWTYQRAANREAARSESRLLQAA
jgi:hypothetical protein